MIGLEFFTLWRNPELHYIPILCVYKKQQKCKYFFYSDLICQEIIKEWTDQRIMNMENWKCQTNLYKMLFRFLGWADVEWLDPWIQRWGRGWWFASQVEEEKDQEEQCLVRRKSIQVFNTVFKRLCLGYFLGEWDQMNVMKKVNLNKTLHLTAINFSNIEHKKKKKIFGIFGMMADWDESYKNIFFSVSLLLVKM